MITFELLALIALVGLSIGDLAVGVINDAVNFINSAIGAKVASRKIILLVAALGILIGATFSAGMLEVARKGIFNPSFFTIEEIIVLFTAVAMADIILLDLFNTFGIPTSTTVTIVFELLGAALFLAFWKLGNFDSAWQVINTPSALKIISGILLSIIIAFSIAIVVQFFTRLLFTFDYLPRFKKFGFLWCSISLTSLVFYIMLEGGKNASYMTAQSQEWIKTNTVYILGITFIGFSFISHLLIKKNINVLKIIILIGTGALAMAFAGNDLVNFIGVSVAGVQGYLGANLSGQIYTPTWILLLAGIIMVVAMFISKKAHTVTYTEVNLGSHDQKEAIGDWKSNILALNLVKMISYLINGISLLIPLKVKKWLKTRFDHTKLTREHKAAFDYLRASVNLMLSASLISYATSKKLPLSTTFVTFMVAMGTSLADGAWDKNSAPSRITGVMTVLLSWFLTALMAIIISGITVSILYYAKTIGLLFLLIMIAFLIKKLIHVHHKHLKTKQSRIDSYEALRP